MYQIVKGLDGKFYCSVRLQDGVEMWTDDTLEEAIRTVISGAKTCNNATITEKNIVFLQEQTQVRTVTVVVPWSPPLTKTSEDDRLRARAEYLQRKAELERYEELRRMFE